MRILFVCLGNICRSPSAEGVMRHVLEREGLLSEVELDSAGTGGWHVGEPPDARASEAARKRGIELTGRARKVTPEDFERFDLILAMDGSNLHALRQLAPDEQARGKVRMLRELDPGSDPVDLDVPDPYYGGEGGFERVLDLLQAACEGLLEHVRAGLAGAGDAGGTFPPAGAGDAGGAFPPAGAGDAGGAFPPAGAGDAGGTPRPVGPADRPA